MIAVLCVLAPCLVAKVETFLKEGRSQRETALRSGVSRGSVGNIYHGRRKLRESIPAESAPAFRSDSPPRRCSVCGATIYPPCQACQVRRLLASGTIKPKRFGDLSQADELTIMLSPEDRQQYDEIHAAKLAADQQGSDNGDRRSASDEDAEPNDEELRRIEGKPIDWSLEGLDQPVDPMAIGPPAES